MLSGPVQVVREALRCCASIHALQSYSSARCRVVFACLFVGLVVLIVCYRLRFVLLLAHLTVEWCSSARCCPNRAAFLGKPEASPVTGLFALATCAAEYHSYGHLTETSMKFTIISEV